MIKLSCSCGATFEINTGASAETKQSGEWLDRHQQCADAYCYKYENPEPKDQPTNLEKTNA